MWFDLLWYLINHNLKLFRVKFLFHLTLGNWVQLCLREGRCGTVAINAHPVSLLYVSVVLKSLGTNRELAALDNSICSININTSTCSSSSSRDDSCSSSSSSCQAGAAMQLLLKAWVIPKNDLQGMAGSFSADIGSA
jgi:hypothetical protein